MEEKKQPEQYRFFSHRQCEYFPCHRTEHPEDFNCLFCYCPLYALGDKCGGNFKYLENGIKDCSQCLLPHRRNSYDYVIGKYPEIMELARRPKNTPSQNSRTREPAAPSRQAPFFCMCEKQLRHGTGPFPSAVTAAHRWSGSAPLCPGPRR